MPKAYYMQYKYFCSAAQSFLLPAQILTFFREGGVKVSPRTACCCQKQKISALEIFHQILGIENILPLTIFCVENNSAFLDFDNNSPSLYFDNNSFNKKTSDKKSFEKKTWIPFDFFHFLKLKHTGFPRYSR